MPECGGEERIICRRHASLRHHPGTPLRDRLPVQFTYVMTVEAQRCGQRQQVLLVSMLELSCLQLGSKRFGIGLLRVALGKDGIDEITHGRERCFARPATIETGQTRRGE